MCHRHPLEIKDAASNLAGAASDTSRQTVADPIKNTAGRVTDKTPPNFNLLKDEAISQ